MQQIIMKVIEPSWSPFNSEQEPTAEMPLKLVGNDAGLAQAIELMDPFQNEHTLPKMPRTRDFSPHQLRQSINIAGLNNCASLPAISAINAA